MRQSQLQLINISFILSIISYLDLIRTRLLTAVGSAFGGAAILIGVAFLAYVKLSPPEPEPKNKAADKIPTKPVGEKTTEVVNKTGIASKPVIVQQL